MNRNRLQDVAVVGLAGVAGVAGSYALAGFTPEFVAAPVAGVAARRLPGFVIRFSIVVLGDLGQKLNLFTAIVASVGLLGLTAAAGLLTARRLESPAAGPLLAGVLAWGVAAALTSAPLSSLGAAVPVAAVLGIGALAGTDGEPTFSGRRSVVTNLAAVAGFSGLAYLLGDRSTARRTGGDAPGGAPTRTPFPSRDTATPAAGSDATTPAEQERESAEGTPTEEQTSTPSESDRLLSMARERSLEVEGLGPLVSRGFYQVDINAVDPTVKADEWSLSVTGAVDEELTLDFRELRSRPAREEFVTLRCVGDKLNGKKLDNAVWTVTDAMPLLEEAGLPDGSCCVMLRAADDYYEEFPLAAMQDAVLAYGMNGEPLPRGHGAPVRALVPGHWGEINVKWLTEIEVLNEPADGYWEERGWHGTGPVNTVAKLWATNTLDDGRVQVAGPAYAGTRGISAVEVSTDGGETWTEARLSEELPGTDVWRQWVYEYDPPGGKHEVVVRAREADGTLQPEEETGPFPRGASGWVSKTVNQ